MTTDIKTFEELLRMDVAINTILVAFEGQPICQQLSIDDIFKLYEMIVSNGFTPNLICVNHEQH